MQFFFYILVILLHKKWYLIEVLICISLVNNGASLVAQMVKNSPAMRETWVQSLGWEDLLENGTSIHSNILAWRIPGTV